MKKEELAQQLHSCLYGTGKTLATAESCTGGGIASAIVSVSGASDYFKGGIVSYCNEVKMKLLGVSAQTLEEQTAVCEDVARQMCQGAMTALDTDYAISITGCAGPGGGTADIPVGTIWIAYGGRKEIRTCKLTEDKGRAENLQNAIEKALQLIIIYLNN